MSQPLVSILMPYKNTATYLKACLDSILEQSYPHWELIAIDDASTDGSSGVLKSYSEKDERIYSYKNTGSGIIAALQTAYAKCSGGFITRMDSDDLMMPHRFHLMIQTLLENGLGFLAVGQVRYFSANGIGNGYQRYETWLNGLTEKGLNFSEIYKECVVPSPCWMVHRKDFDACGGFNSNRYPEDYDLAFRFYEGELQVIPCSEVLLLWRDYEDRTSRTSAHYAQNYFLEIKLHYFLRLHYDTSKRLVVWGAGKKGKQIAQLLLAAHISFNWVCDNPKKIGKDIYGITMQGIEDLESLANFQTIITVANESEQQEIRTHLHQLEKKPMQDYFFFC